MCGHADAIARRQHDHGNRNCRLRNCPATLHGVPSSLRVTFRLKSHLTCCFVFQRAAPGRIVRCAHIPGTSRATVPAEDISFIQSARIPHHHLTSRMSERIRGCRVTLSMSLVATFCGSEFVMSITQDFPHGARTTACDLRVYNFLKVHREGIQEYTYGCPWWMVSSPHVSRSGCPKPSY